MVRPQSAAYPFVGRETQLRVLDAAVAAAAAGQGGVALVGGEPGIGKTRLAEQVAQRARAAGLRVRWSTCWQDHGAPPFWPWIELLREHARERDPAALRAEFGADAGEIARLVPELVGRRAESPPEGGGARLRLFDGVAAFLRRAAQASPLLLVVEDLHWADTGSLLLLRFLASGLRGSRLLVLGTYRDVEARAALEALLGTLAGAREHLVLEGLTSPEVADLMGELGAASPLPEQVASMHRRTNGNPLFVRELARLLDDADGPDGRVPDGVRDVIQRRLDRLSAPCSELLEAAAVIGERFRLDLLQAVSGLEDEALAGLLDEAVAAHLVERVDGAAPAARFTRALVQEVLYQGLASGRRQRLHHHVGRAIEERNGSEQEPRQAELARHFQLAGVGGDRVKAVRYATQAGRVAMHMLVYEEAAGHFVSALEMLGAERGGGLDSCELLLLLADALRAAGEMAAARSTYERAAELARSLRAAGPQAQAALGVGVGTTVGVVDHVEIRLLEQAVDAVGPDDGTVRARLLARLARALHGTASLERRRVLSDAAVAMARRLGDPPTLAAVLLDHCGIISSAATPEEGLAITGEVVGLAERAGDEELSLRARRLRIANLLELGDLDAVRTELEISHRMANGLRRPEHRWHEPLVRSGLATLAGRFEEAEALSQEGLRLGRIAQEPGIAVYHQALVVVVRHLQGRLPELVPQLTDQVARYPAVAEWRCVLALALSAAGRNEDARRELEKMAADDAATLARQHSTRYSLAMLALVCDALADVRRAEALHSLLAPHAAYFVQLGRSGTGCLGSMAHYLGVLCCTLSRWEEAVEHLEAAIEMNARIGAAAFVAGSRFECARALRAIGGAEAEARAAEHLDRAREAAAALGLGSPRTAAAAGPVLSRREWEVAELVASGLSNGEIAERLVISKRTAESHVDHIRQKLAVGSRAGIMSWVLTAGGRAS